MSRKTIRSSKTPTALNRAIGYTLTLLVFVGCFGLSTIYLRHRTASTANEIKQLERAITLEKRKLAEQGAEITRLTTRDSLKRLNNLHALGLQMPSERQIVRVLEDPTKRLYEKSSENLLTVSRF